MSQPTELGPGEHLRFGTLAFSGVTRVFIQNLDDRYSARVRVRPVGPEVTDLVRKVLGQAYYTTWEDDLAQREIKELPFLYAGAIMEVTNVGHTRVKVWTDL